MHAMITRINCCMIVAVLSVAFIHPTDGNEVDFARDIQPILAKRCFACHGPAEREAGLAFHNRILATSKLESEKQAIVPGAPQQSELLRRITANDDSERMPPEGKALAAREIELLREWIEQGAEYATHWSFVSPTRPITPEANPPIWTNNEIDHFVLDRIKRDDIAPSPPADKAKLLRRGYLDLIGLLPTSEDLDAFLADDSEAAFEGVVDRLLASEHFGERWGRHWLDLARYADTFGYERDDVRPNAWRYRDWVIQSINRNQPFDEFVIEQLAGDLLPEPTRGQQLATGLHRMNIKNNESGINKEDYRNRETVDRVNTTGTALLGLTIGCCQCHSHKYDPLSQDDYYSLYAFFNNVEEKDVDIEGTQAERDRYEQAQQAYNAKKKRLEARQKLLAAMQEFKSFAAWQESVQEDKLAEQLELVGIRTGDDASTEMFWSSLESQADDTKKAIRQLSVDQRHLPKPYIMTLAEASENRRNTHVLERGDFKQPGKQVIPATPELFGSLTARNETPDRLDLARWIVRPKNPLTARVAVNHIWKHLFGAGLVASVDDFGTQGDAPTHPRLLDWLAVELIESGWDRKHVIKTILMSATYQQSARSRPELIAIDPENRLLARQSRLRVESEIVRDLFLDASGLLHRDVGGPTVYPRIPEAVGDLGYKYKTRWIVSSKPERYRRGIYIHFKRTNPYPSLLMFDGPESNLCQAKRNRSNTPLQALATLNDPVFVECAQALGRTLASESTTPRARIALAGTRCLTRILDERELASLMKLFESERTWYTQHSEDAALVVGEYTTDGTPSAAAAAWVAVARAIMNLDEFVTRE